MPDKKIVDMAYAVFEKFNDLNASMWEVEQSMEYMYKRILPYQINQNLQRMPDLKFEVKKPSNSPTQGI